ncbi:MAG: type II toxin-antitoxin system HicA family toxin [Devosia sp.]|nr:type II toxin-antitoxin system HicA family toxin [Devosia sp.]
MASQRLPVVSGKAVVRALRKAGFELSRVNGSHHAMIHRGPPFRLVSVPVHGSKPLKVGTFSAILDQAGLTAQEFMALL